MARPADARRVVSVRPDVVADLFTLDASKPAFLDALRLARVTKDELRAVADLHALEADIYLERVVAFWLAGRVLPALWSERSMGEVLAAAPLETRAATVELLKLAFPADGDELDGYR